jgi:hypothetical protein
VTATTRSLRQSAWDRKNRHVPRGRKNRPDRIRDYWQRNNQPWKTCPRLNRGKREGGDAAGAEGSVIVATARTAFPAKRKMPCQEIARISKWPTPRCNQARWGAKLPKS